MSNPKHADLPDRLRDVEALDPGGEPVRLGTLWAERPCVLVFVRHFG